MSYLIDYPKPQNADIQTFVGIPTSAATYPNKNYTWIKPQGVSFVWFTLIGAGGYTNGNTGSGSGAVTNALLPAFLIPDILRVNFVASNASTYNSTNIIYDGRNSAGYTLLTANSGYTTGNVANGGPATAANTQVVPSFGLYQSVAGQNGTSNASLSASSTTFLSAGIFSNSTTTYSNTANYGYSISGNYLSEAVGLFQISPIIVGLGNITGANNRTAGIGCGSALNGGPGAVFIISW